DDESIANIDTIDWIDQTTNELEDLYAEIITGTQSIASVIELLPDSNELETSKDIEEALNDLPESQRKLLINKDNTETLITLFISDLSTEELEELIVDIEKDLEDSPVDISITGRSVLDLE